MSAAAMVAVLSTISKADSLWFLDDEPSVNSAQAIVSLATQSVESFGESLHRLHRLCSEQGESNDTFKWVQ